MLVVQLPRQCKSLEEVLERIGRTVGLNGRISQPRQRFGQRGYVAACTRDFDAGLRKCEPFHAAAGHVAHGGGHVQCAASRQVLLLRVRMRERLQHHPVPEFDFAVGHPHEEGVSHPQAGRATFGYAARVGEREQDVLPLGVEAGEPGVPLLASEFALRMLGECDVEFEMPVAGARVLARFGEALQRVLPHGLQQSVALALCIERDQRLVDQVPQQVQHVARRDVVARADRLGRVERESAGEHRQPLQQRALAGREQVVAPVDRCAQRLLARQRRLVAALQQRGTGRSGARRSRRPTSSELAPRPARAPAGCRRGRGRFARPPRRSRASTRNPDERRSRDRRNSCTAAYSPSASGARSLAGSGTGSVARGNTASPATWSGSRLVASDRHPGAGLQEVPRQLRAREQQMLAIVEDEQERAGQRRTGAASR